MKSSALLLSFLTSGTLAAQHEEAGRHQLRRRQFDLSGIITTLGESLGAGGRRGGGLFASPQKREKLQPIIRKTANRERIWFGPYNLPGVDAPRSGVKLPLQMDPIGVQIDRQISGFCTDCTVLAAKAQLFFENGTQATVEHGVYEHHVVMVDLAKRSVPFYWCDGQKGFLGSFPASGFVVSGNDEAANMFTTPDGSFNSGYVIGSRQTVAMQAELVNYRKEEQKVYVTVDYEWIKGKSDADSVVSLFSVTGCGFPDYHRDPNKKVYNMSSATLPIPADGFIVNAKGHLHDGGDHIILEINGKAVCDSHAIYGRETEEKGVKWAVIEKMEQCTTPIKVNKGDKIRMISYYDTARHPPRPTEAGKGHQHGEGEADEMGVFFINFAVTNKTANALKIAS